MPARLLTYEAILGSLGQNLVRAQSGEEALAKLLEMDVATILLDVSMPGMDGFETAAMIRGHPRFAQTPIIFVTGVHLTEIDRLRGYEMGAVDYVSVPVMPEILRGKVQVLVQLYLQRRELTRLNETMAAANVELAAAHAALKTENTRELHQLNRTLERANEQLLAEVAERKRAQTLLQEEIKRKDDFLAILAHELRNPLSAMHNGVQLMHATNLSSERMVWVRDLLDRQITHLTRLIDDLLDVRRITTGRIQLKREPLDLEAVMQHSVEAVRPLVDSRRHTLVVHEPQRVVRSRGGPVRLSQVFVNLLTNAAKYTPECGRIELTLERDAVDPRGSACVCATPARVSRPSCWSTCSSCSRRRIRRKRATRAASASGFRSCAASSSSTAAPFGRRATGPEWAASSPCVCRSRARWSSERARRRRARTFLRCAS